MAEVTNTSYSGGMRVTNYSNEKLLLFGCDFTSATYTNGDAYDETLAIGTVMGRIASTGKIVPVDSAASDGSQFPVGVLAASYTVASGVDAELRMVVSGEINANMLVFPNGETLDTVVSDKQMRDRLASDTVGLILSFPDELSALDNQ